MQIPQSVKIGRRRYTIYRVPRVSKMHTGQVFPEAAVIKIGNDSANKALSFWHEVTHAILHDMGENWRDERFVERFSRRLERAIRTAEFNGPA